MVQTGFETIGAENLKAWQVLQVTWLHGARAQGLEVTGSSHTRAGSGARKSLRLRAMQRCSLLEGGGHGRRLRGPY